MSTTAQVRYRHAGSGMEPGTHLLLCTSAFQLVMGFYEFRDHTGLLDTEVLSDPVVATPVPLYSATPAPGCWPTLEPAALWHPLLWLPEGVVRRRSMAGEREPDLVWAVRVCLEAQAAELYEPDQGWRDILAEYGIDVGQADGLNRVATWMQGRQDPVLAGIDLTDRLLDGGAWALDAAAGILPNLQGRAWALIADELLGFIAEAEANPKVAHSRAQTLAGLAFPMLHSAASPDAEPAATFWERVETQIEDAGNDEQQLLAGPLATATTWLTETRSYHWRHINEIEQLVSSVAAEAN